MIDKTRRKTNAISFIINVCALLCQFYWKMGTAKMLKKEARTFVRNLLLLFIIYILYAFYFP